MAKTPAWQRKEGKNPNGGLNAKGRASAEASGSPEWEAYSETHSTARS